MKATYEKATYDPEKGWSDGSTRHVFTPEDTAKSRTPEALAKREETIRLRDEALRRLEAGEKWPDVARELGLSKHRRIVIAEAARRKWLL